MSLSALTKSCGSQQPPGAKEVFYFTYIGELASWPQTEAEAAGTDPGDTVMLSEAFDFAGADPGEGFWRKVTAILVDTPVVRNTMEGQIGGQGFRQRYDFFLPLNDAKTLEWLNELLAASGCIVCLIPTKAGNYHVMGNLEAGVYVEAADGGTGGDRVGYQITLYANTGKTTLLYDAANDGINETPAT